MTRRPVVGVTSSRGGGRYMWWFYWLSMQLFRVRPVRLVAPVARLSPERFDGLIIGGGDDIGAEIYRGETTLDVRIDPARDAMELSLLEHAIDTDTPVLGICRGAQMLNVHYGGTLHQDMRKVYSHHPEIWSPLPRKEVRLAEGSRIAGVMRRERVVVNSLHRQAIDRLGTGLEVSGRDEYGTIQAIEHPAETFRVGVQWHPEFLIYQRAQRRLFDDFVKAVRRRSAAREAEDERRSTAAG